MTRHAQPVARGARQTGVASGVCHGLCEGHNCRSKRVPPCWCEPSPLRSSRPQKARRSARRLPVSVNTGPFGVPRPRNPAQIAPKLKFEGVPQPKRKTPQNA